MKTAVLFYIVIGIFLVMCLRLLLCVSLSVRHIKRLMQEDQAYGKRIRTFNDAVHETVPAEGQSDVRATIDELMSAYNEQADRHDTIDYLRKEMMLTSVMTAAAGILMAIAALFGA